jgi:hypothetical protein
MEQACKLVRAALTDGPQPVAKVEALAKVAKIPAHSLIAAASVLGVRTQRGQWWLPG